MNQFTPIWRVGFSGHRKLSDEALVRDRLDSIWNELAQRVDGEFEAYTSLAEGADILFAESAVAAGKEIHLLLPFRREEFLADISPEWRSRFEAMSGSALSVEEGSFSNDRNESYYACGKAVIDASDVMVFCWDGKKERGHGGTAEIVGAARERGIPLVWLHSETGEVVYENFPNEPLRDPFTGEVESLVGPRAASHEPGEAPDATELLDDLASHMAPRYRFFTTTNIVVHVTAITIAVLGLKYAHGDWKQAAAGAKAILLFGTIALFFYVRRQRLHDAWLTCRVAAELGRSLKACAGFLPVSAVEHLLRPFAEQKRLVRRCIQEAQRRARGLSDLSSRKAVYQRERLEDQEGYYRRAGERLSRLNRRLAAAFWVCSISGFVSAVVYWIMLGPDWLGVLTILLPVAAMMFLAVMSTLDVERRLERFQEMQLEVEEAMKHVDAARDERGFSREVEVIEQALLSEVAEWYRRTRHIHIH
jgi:hypothetical protein